jgi:hypothetical protein
MGGGKKPVSRIKYVLKHSGRKEYFKTHLGLIT